MNAAPRAGRAQSMIHVRSGPRRMFSGLKSVCSSASPSSRSQAGLAVDVGGPALPGLFHWQGLPSVAPFQRSPDESGRLPPLRQRASSSAMYPASQAL